MADDLPLALMEAIERGREAAVHALAAEMDRRGLGLSEEDGLFLVDSAVRRQLDGVLVPLLALTARGRPPPSQVHALAFEALERGQHLLFVELLERGALLEGVALREPHLEGIALAIAGRRGIPRLAIDELFGTATRPSERAMFLYQALAADRLDLAGHLLERGAHAVAPARPTGQTDSTHLMAAVRLGAIDLVRPLVLRGARVNHRDGRGLTPLHEALLSPGLAATVRAGLVHELLRQWAVPEIVDPGGRDAFALATRLGDPEVNGVLRAHGHAYGPRQSREARRAGIRDICLCYDKADGFIYRIGQPDAPFIVGGDYDGAFEAGVLQASATLARLLPLRPELAWFMAFMGRLERGEEFPLEELMAFSGRFSVFGFGQRTSWRLG